MDYGIIGNYNTIALISKEGSIDWCCFPRFDSPSVFARILDQEKGGYFSIKPASTRFNILQRYVSNTNVLETKFHNKEYEFVIHDFFPCYLNNGKLMKEQQVIRILKPIRGEPSIKLVFDPRLNYALSEPQVELRKDVIIARSGDHQVSLSSNLHIDKLTNGSFELREPVFFAVAYEDSASPKSLGEAQRYLDFTIAYWQNLVRMITIPEQYKDAVIRSFLVLELLTYKDSGAIVAAPTTSLPEIIGKDRNWDYRYAWLRDASLAIDALTKLCHFDEAEGFIRWILKICMLCGVDLQIMYGVEGERNLEEKILPHLAGYKNSRPVRIGNAAYTQKQIDVVGEILQAIYLYFVHYNYAQELTVGQWELIRNLVEYVMDHWSEEDSGIWEFRNVKRHFTFSKVLSWVALDRGIKIAQHFNKNETIHEWIEVREQIQRDILTNGWNSEAKAFTQYYGSKDLDASLLLMPYYGFLKPSDPRIKSTVERIAEGLLVEGLVYRYLSEDDFGFPENAFTVCTFWLVDALFMIGRREEARVLFERTLKYSNHLGLFSEDINPKTREQTGNFPQAYTHIALINSAVLLTQREIKRPICKLKLEV